MRHCSDPRSFYAQNHSEVSKMTISLCASMGFDSPKDVEQELYTNIVENGLLDQYDPSRAKISTYIYEVIKNIVKRLSAKERRFLHYNGSIENMPSDMDEFDALLQVEHVDPDFQNISERNAASDIVQGIAAEIADFDENFLQVKNRDKTFKFSRRKKKDISKGECSLSKLLGYIYKGYSCHTISDFYGVTDMTMTHMKHRLAKVMVKYGRPDYSFK